MNLVRFKKPCYNVNSSLVDELFNSLNINDTIEKHRKVTPPTNIIETKDFFKIELMLPGFNKENIQLSFQNELLTVKMNNKTEKANMENGEKYIRHEFGIFEFEKQFAISEDIDNKNIKAEFNDGILTIILPKKEKSVEKDPVAIEIS
ncbi:MAG: hypothetical protein CR996_01655 [Draconibacterium sp.]|nr:MAG: hypothetical protein CR996_01655 [Draconibacterium sp.]PIF05175.1 MAG: hypothetical protein CSA36_08105 [Draconibacterium sp.]